MDGTSFIVGMIAATILRLFIDIFYNEIKRLWRPALSKVNPLAIIGALVCAAGMHQWHYYHKMMGPFGFMCRSCKSCGKIQHLNDYNDCNKWTNIDDEDKREYWLDDAGKKKMPDASAEKPVPVKLNIISNVDAEPLIKSKEGQQ